MEQPLPLATLPKPVPTLAEFFKNTFPKDWIKEHHWPDKAIASTVKDLPIETLEQLTDEIDWFIFWYRKGGFTPDQVEPIFTADFESWIIPSMMKMEVETLLLEIRNQAARTLVNLAEQAQSKQTQSGAHKTTLGYNLVMGVIVIIGSFLLASLVWAIFIRL